MRVERKTVLIWAICIGLLVTCGWMLTTENGFLMDDYTNLSEEMFKDPADSFTILPTQRYNNRPVGRIFVSILQKIFNTNYQGYHFVFVAIHLVNVFLVYKIAAVLFAMSSKIDSEYAPLVAAAIFGIYPQSVMAVQWISAVFDLLGCFFALCALYAFLKRKKSEQYRAFYGIVAFIAIILSLRTKEMAILMPVFFAILDIAFKKLDLQKKWISLTTILSMGYSLIYLGVLFSFSGLSGTEYEQGFGVLLLIRNLLRYIGLYFDVQNMTMIFESYNAAMIAGIIVTLLSVCYVVYLLFKNEWFPFAALLGIGLMLVPVLTMGNMQHKLYLYIPAVFVGLYFASVISLLQNKVESFPRETMAIILVVVLTVLNYSPGAKSFRTWWCSMTAQDAAQIKQLYRMGEIPQFCNIYVRGADKDYNAIYPYGPGNSLRFIYGRNDINCYVVDEFPEYPVKPYLCIDYENGSFTEVSRYDQLEVEIIGDVYLQWAGEDLQIGITCSPIHSSCQIVVNGTAYPTTIGETFISTSIKKSELDQNTVEISVILSDMGIESERVLCEIPSGN